jgi:hypothetical protein
MWSKELGICARAYADATLSSVEDDGYPFSARCEVALDDQREVITFTRLPEIASRWRGPACLLFHRFDERLENQYQLLIRGRLVQENERLVFRPSAFVTASGSRTSDRMPHAGAPLQLIQFMRLGRRQARAYLRRRRMAWPVDFTPMLRVLRDLPPHAPG